MVSISIVDRVTAVGSQEAVDMTKRLLREEDLMVGVSSGGNVHATLKVAGGLGDGQTAVIILPDRRERYLSMNIQQPKLFQHSPRI